MKKIGFIGFGNMASAIALGIINAKFLNANEIIAYDIDENKAEKCVLIILMWHMILMN